MGNKNTPTNVTPPITQSEAKGVDGIRETLWSHIQVCIECGKMTSTEPMKFKQYMRAWPRTLSQSTQCSYDGTCGGRDVFDGWVPEGYLPITMDYMWIGAPEYIGQIPLRTEVTVLPADVPRGYLPMRGEEAYL